MAITTVRAPYARGLVVALALLAAACTGVIGGGAERSLPGGKTAGSPSAGAGNVPGSGPASLSDPVDCEAASVGAAPLLRITRSQYTHTVRDLFANQDLAASVLPDDEKLGAFYSNASAPLAALDVEKYFDAAAEVAASAVSKLAELSPCDRAALGDVACAENLTRDWGRRLFRRPLVDEELSEFAGVFQAHSADGFENAMRLILTAMLASPYFLYRVELGASSATGSPSPVGDYELASRLAFFLWDSTPDEELLDVADSHELSKPEVLQAQGERLLADPRARDMVANFHRQWLGLDKLSVIGKDPELFPDFDSELVRSMQNDTDRFAASVILDGDGRLATLLTAARGFPDSDLSRIYGVQSAAADGSLETALSPSERAGLLTQPAFLAAHAHRDQTSPVSRGQAVRVNLLCAPPPAPPPNVDTTPPEPDPDSSTRERFSEHTADPSCAGCHALLDPIGFAFEHYDAIGAFRTLDGGEPVDATGEITGTRDADGTFDGAIELVGELAQSEQVRECLAKQWFEYAIGHAPGAADTCSLVESYEAFKSSDFDVRKLMLAITLSDAFRLRKDP